MYVAGYLRKTQPDLKMEIVDLRQSNMTESGIADIIHKSSPDIIGISSVNMEAKLTHTLIGIAKSVNKNIKAIIGGPYAILFHILR